MRFQKFMWRNMMRPTKSQKASVLRYSIDTSTIIYFLDLFTQFTLK
jgi:hypothetical protein